MPLCKYISVDTVSTAISTSKIQILLEAVQSSFQSPTSEHLNQSGSFTNQFHWIPVCLRLFLRVQLGTRWPRAKISQGVFKGLLQFIRLRTWSQWPVALIATLCSDFASMSSPSQMTCVFETCLRDKTGSNWKSQLRCSFLKTLLLVWKVDVAELLFEIAACSCLKPPIPDSLLLSGSKEESMLTAPFKSCWTICGVESRCCWAPCWNCQLLLSQATTNHGFLASQWQQGRENVNCSIQILLEAVEILVSVSNISSMKSQWFFSPTKNVTKPILFASFLKNLLQLRKVNVAELSFEIAACSCLKPPVADSFLRSGSWEENMLTAPFKSCLRPCRSSFQCPTSGPDLLPECQTCQQPLH